MIPFLTNFSFIYLQTAKGQAAAKKASHLAFTLRVIGWLEYHHVDFHKLMSLPILDLIIMIFLTFAS